MALVSTGKLAADAAARGVGVGAFNVITLDVKDGVVTLGGTVHDYPSKDSAIGIAETTPGVKDVVDNIEVAPTSMFDDQLRVKLYRAIDGAPPCSATRWTRRSRSASWSRMATLRFTAWLTTRWTSRSRERKPAACRACSAWTTSSSPSSR